MRILYDYYLGIFIYPTIECFEWDCLAFTFSHSSSSLLGVALLPFSPYCSSVTLCLFTEDLFAICCTYSQWLTCPASIFYGLTFVYQLLSNPLLMVYVVSSDVSKDMYRLRNILLPFMCVSLLYGSIFSADPYLTSQFFSKWRIGQMRYSKK